MAPAKQQRERDKLTPERIVAIARQKGEFVASWRWRDDWLRLRCKMMCKAGLLQEEIDSAKGLDAFGFVCADAVCEALQEAMQAIRALSHPEPTKEAQAALPAKESP